MEANYYSYHVTKDGRVFNKWGAELKQQRTPSGYLVVGITVSPYKKITKSIHRLVAEVYIPNTYKLSDVDHIDGDKDNNNVTNLRWLTHGENIRHSYKLGNRSCDGENNARSILSNLEVHDICTLFEKGYSCANLRDMGYPYHLIRPIKNRRNWKSISKDYTF